MKIRYPDRVIYPLAGFRKRDVLDDYERVAPSMLPHLRDRPVTLKRYPDQAQGEFFYERTRRRSPRIGSRPAPCGGAAANRRSTT